MFRAIFSLLAMSVLTCSLFAQTVVDKSQPVLDVGSMDKSVDPCADFFMYSCGGWLKKNPIPPDQTSWSVSSKLQDENLLILRDILDRAANPAPGRSAVTQKIGDYYAACMNEKAVNSAGLEPLRDQLQAIDHLKSKQDIAALVATMIYDNVLFDFHSNQDYKNSEQVIAEADQGGWVCPIAIFISCRIAKPASCGRRTRRTCAARSICWVTRLGWPKMNPMPSCALRPRWQKGP